MAGEIIEERLERLKVGSIIEHDSPFCLALVGSLSPDYKDLGPKIQDLLDGRIVDESKNKVERACNIGGCSLRTVEDTETGRSVEGTCKAATYCLKQCFEAVGAAPTVEEGKALYRDIVDSLEGHAGKHSAGNFCPKLDCGLSAGVSIDMVPGTAGICKAEVQPSLPLESGII